MAPPSISLTRTELLDLERALGLEWLETDGLGGSASSTALLCPTRRYHALLSGPRPGTVERHVWLSRFEERVRAGGAEFPLSIARYRGLWAPHGHAALESFELAPWPRWTWLWGDLRVVREVLVPRGQACVLVRWAVHGGAAELELRPLLPFRAAHALTVENEALDRRVEPIESGIACTPYAALPRIAIVTDRPAHFAAESLWFRGVELAAELARGYDGHEDQFSPGAFRVALADGEDVVLQASLGDALPGPRARFERECARRTEERERAGDGVAGTLAIAAGHYLHTSGGRTGVIAGWPWFGEWGRDTFLSLPGLAIARREPELLGAALEGSLPFLRDGLMPNVFGATPAESDYGSADAALWFARAVRLCERQHPRGFTARFLPALLEIAERYKAGTGLGLALDDEGQLRAGSPELNATWMDARVDGLPVTPRDGCAVEIAALWYQLLDHLGRLLRGAGREREARGWERLCERAGETFLRRFWLADEERLADVWRPEGVDRAMRPNMVIAAALEASPLTRAQRGLVAKAAREVLLTPRGLRTLDPRAPQYQGRYRGGIVERDRAYHQGTVWPWLLGFFVEAWLTGVGDGPEEREWLASLLDGFAPHFLEAGLGQVSEVFDGDPPHAPGGCFAQAWSVAELARACALVRGPRA